MLYGGVENIWKMYFKHAKMPQGLNKKAIKHFNILNILKFKIAIWWWTGLFHVLEIIIVRRLLLGTPEFLLDIFS